MAGTNMNICNMKDMKWFLAILLGIFALWYMNGSSCSKTVEYMKHALSDTLSPMDVEDMKTNEHPVAKPTTKPPTTNSHENPTRCMNSNWVSSNLLPKNDNVVSTDGFEFAPKVDMQNMNFLNSESVIGVDTQTSSLRNSNVQLRSEPPNPKTEVSPWLNSTIEPDLTRRPLE
jgi:hypothetical protein